MLRTSIIFASLLVVSTFGQSCNPLKTTAPCAADFPCETGSTCDLTLSECCLNADLITTTAAASATSTVSSSSSTSSSGFTVTSRTSSSTGCVDKVNPSTGVSDCTKNIALCNDSNYYDVMTQQCPKTCGRCSSVSTTSSSGSCVDLKNPKTGTSDCPTLARLCNDSNYISLMRTQCPKTCGFCGSSSTVSSATTSRTATVSSGTCVDKTNPSTGASDCVKNKALCNDSNYQTVMRSQCPKTCGFC